VGLAIGAAAGIGLAMNNVMLGIAIFLGLGVAIGAGFDSRGRG
jgi:hypothetical protein